jgi:peptidoglycan hydrolase CwlO-like protein
MEAHMGHLIGLLFSALAVSAVAAYFSIVGLMAIFSGLPQSILAMGVVLEIAKLVTASWVYQYWKKTSLLMRSYMVSAVIILSVITSIGIFGFLSKAHLDQSASTGDAVAQVERIEDLIQRENLRITTAEEQITRIESGGSLDVSESIKQQEEIRDTAWDRIQDDVQYAENQIEKIREGLESDLSKKQSELDALDDIVKSYTDQGTTGGVFSREDNVAKGIEIRESQKTERDRIALEMGELRGYAETQIAGYRNQIGEYRASVQDTIDGANREINRLREQGADDQASRDEQIDTIQERIDSAYAKIDEYNVELFDKQSIVRDIEKEVGPIKYVAQLLYGNSGAGAVDNAVTLLILLLVFVFDPLAIVLVLAANLSWKERQGELITPMTVDETVVEEQIIPEEEPAGMPTDELPEMDDWVKDKYGISSGMDNLSDNDKKKLEWLIDKKRNNTE